ncbi:rust resistance kinase Lr10-like [Humulus lupulus]|uniref:rust resistance kinase Lr10-like n=1 Tax=Humulus lupulus TaxID=3486 RepID=UPI002B411192|nr:rust resistance kinase Lr10-like [Humulus lupulus]
MDDLSNKLVGTPKKREWLQLLLVAERGASHGDECKEARCGEKGPPIRSPFRLKGRQPPHCGLTGFDLSCFTTGSFEIVLGFLATFYVYHIEKQKRENGLRIEKFLEDYIALKPSRYTYADVKNITNDFKDKLGEGAYGIVFKGALSNDILVAVKILNNVEKGNGEEFINEVATIGQIHHVNVVRLVGYCADGFRRALVYEFLPNDSLEKYISIRRSTGTEICSLSWEKLFDIALGTAKGIEYLHQDCDKRIIHFDIKPQNILLDHNFKPKIADFGLAKLCSKDQSIVSMTTARGTIGYIAPEVFSRNFGNVSYKSDVYSFGMLLLEIVGGRRNNNMNEIYYPEWIFNLLEEGEDLRVYINSEEGDDKIPKKLAIVGLRCIQWHPTDRPTMKDVIQMLEGNEELSIPPNPFSSTNSSKLYTKMPNRIMANLELETIAE